MTDFHNAGGMLSLLYVLRPLLQLSATTITRQTLGEVLDATLFRPLALSQLIIRLLSNLLYPLSSLVVLQGNLALSGAILKASASKVLRHPNPAVVSKNSADLALRIDDPHLAVTRDSVLVLQGIGP
jgi:dihydroxy-acid dehydratase